MDIITTKEFQLDNDTAVTIGKFDGIHRGHRLLLDSIIEKKKQGLKACVFTFDKSPLEFFSGKKVPSLTTREEKMRIFDYLGVDIVIEYPFDEKSASTDPRDYITNILCKQARMKYIAAGTDLSFGDKGKGDTSLMLKMSDGGKKYITEIFDKVFIDGEEVSSSLIRNVVSLGNMDKAERLIGVPYALSGEVLHGRKLGRTMGFPTVNVEVSSEKLMPPFGVYFTEISVKGKHYNGITNVGCKPTVTDQGTVFAETNILDFDDDVYGERITVKLLKFSRPERKFLSVDELKDRIAIDIKEGREYFKESISK